MKNSAATQAPAPPKEWVRILLTKAGSINLPSLAKPTQQLALCFWASHKQNCTSECDTCTIRSSSIEFILHRPNPKTIILCPSVAMQHTVKSKSSRHYLEDVHEVSGYRSNTLCQLAVQACSFAAPCMQLMRQSGTEALVSQTKIVSKIGVFFWVSLSYQA